MSIIDRGKGALLLFALLSILPLNVYASNHVDEGDSSTIYWSRAYGGAGTDVGLSMQRTRDGGYVIAGKTKPFGTGEYDVYVVKTKPLPVPVSISCQASANKVKMGQQIFVSGVISPATSGRSITLTYTPPDGLETVRNVEVDEEGAFRDGYTPNLPGLWTVTASTESDAYHEASSSEPASFTAEEPQDVVPVRLRLAGSGHRHRYTLGLAAARAKLKNPKPWNARKSEPDDHRPQRSTQDYELSGNPYDQ